MERKVSGLMMNYYFVCKKKLWYHSKNITLEDSNEDVKIGKIIDETSYSRDNKHINIDGLIQIDFMRNYKVVHEVKKSRAIESAGIFQVKLYLYYLKQKKLKGIKGKIDYPTLRRSLDIELTKEDEEEISEIIDKIVLIVDSEKPPKVKKKGYCKKCAYYEFCFI